jgi:hypothetical protein
MNTERRVRIASLVFWIHRFRAHFWRLLTYPLNIWVKIEVNIIHRTSHRRAIRFQEAVASWNKRVNLLMPELQSLSGLTEARKTKVLNLRSALLDESKQLQDTAQMMRVTPETNSFPGANALLTTAGYFKIKLTDISRKTSSFRTLLSRIESDTFYWDLLLWLIVPGVDSDALLGDLTEEYPLQVSTLGDEGARAWYRYQVATTVRDCVWKKLERILAIGTAIDLIDRWFRK